MMAVPESDVRSLFVARTYKKLNKQKILTGMASHKKKRKKKKKKKKKEKKEKKKEEKKKKGKKVNFF